MICSTIILILKARFKSLEKLMLVGLKTSYQTNKILKIKMLYLMMIRKQKFSIKYFELHILIMALYLQIILKYGI